MIVRRRFAREGEVRGAVLVFREISERKKQDRLLATQARELAEADRRKNEFLATLAHELRNPLSPLEQRTATVAAGERQRRGA